MTPYVPDVDEEDFGDLEESELGQSPIRKSTRESSPDNGSQGGCSSSDNGSQGGSASNPEYEIDSSNLGGRKENQSPTRKRAREGSPDNGSQHEYTSDRGRVRARGRGSDRGGGRARGRGTTGGKGKARGRGKARGKGITKGRGTGRERLVGEGAVPVPLVVPQMKSKWVVPKKIHTPHTEEIFAVRGGREGRELSEECLKFV